ncbi:MAG: hypothetical protein JRF61_10075 [Deltaproteobacteria bacterium]|nr:hypothetical protein [Deltaproteobacteria bacterium]
MSSPDPCERFRRAVDAVYPFELFGLIRAAVLRETCLIGPNPQSDIDLLQDLVLRGDIGRVPEVLFARRSHPDSYSEGTTSFRAGLEWMDPSREVSYAFYCVSRFWRLNAQVLRAPLDRSTRLSCIGLLFARTFRELRRRVTGVPADRREAQRSMSDRRSRVDSRSSGSQACS